MGIRIGLLCFSLLSCLLLSSALAQDTTLVRLLASKDDTLKVQQLLLHGRKARENSYTAAEQIFRAAYETSVRIGYDSGAGKSLSNLAGVTAYQGDFRKAIQHLHQARSYYLKIGATTSIAGYHSGLGGVYGSMGNTDSAIYHFDKALVLLQDKKTSLQAMQLYINLGILHNGLRNFRKAIGYYEKCYAVAIQLKDTAMMTQALGSLSGAFMNLESNDTAYAYASRALTLAQKKNDKKGLAIALNRYASACNRLNKLEEAQKSGIQGLQYFRQLNDLQYQLLISKTLATTLEKQGNLEEAIRILEEAKSLGEKNKLTNNLKDIYESLADLYLQKGNYKTAYEELQKHKLNWDSVVNEKNERAVAELDVKYQTAQKEKELANKQVELLQQSLLLQETKKWMTLAVVATLLALLVAGFVYMNLQYKRKNHARELQALQQEKEIQLLQALMEGEEKERSRIARDLHDGVAGMLAATKMHFSTLVGSTEHVAAEPGYQQGLKLLDEATQELRMTSHNLMPEVLLEHGLEEALRRYCRSVNNKGLQLQYYALGEISLFSKSFELSVYRIVQELVNNMLKHSNASEGLVQIAQQENVLSITIEDNGIGFSQENTPDGTGLHSLYSRVKAMKGTLEIEGSAQKGVSAYLEFDVSALKKYQQEAVSAHV